jgi:hypothetical protein
LGFALAALAALAALGAMGGFGCFGFVSDFCMCSCNNLNNYQSNFIIIAIKHNKYIIIIKN